LNCLEEDKVVSWNFDNHKLVFGYLLTSGSARAKTVVMQFGPFLILAFVLPLAWAGTVKGRGMGQCGNPSSRIVGGKEAKPYSIPWQVVLMHNGDLQCGGSILSRKFVLTAAFCVGEGSGIKPADLVVVAGEHNFKEEEGFETRHKVTKITLKGSFYNWDLALLELSNPISFSGDSKAAPICLPSADIKLKRGTCFEASGWGSLDILDDGSGQTSDKLQKVKLSLSDTTEEWIWADGQNICSGDRGGPLTWVDPKTSRPVLVGVYSEVIWDCSGIGMFGRVSSSLDWIRSIAHDIDDTGCE